MLQTLKQTPRWLTHMATAPYLLAASLRYSFLCMAQAPARRPARPAIADDGFRHMSFTFALIALSARVACADGPLTREKYVAFRENFPLRGGICGKIRQLFLLACRDTTPTAHYAQQLRSLYPNRPELYASVLERLLRIAAAGDVITAPEELLLADIARQLGVGASAFAQLLARHHRPVRAHQVLGLPVGVPSRTLKKRYHELMRRYHPDRFALEEISPELRLLLKHKTAEINDAYKVLSRKAA